MLEQKSPDADAMEILGAAHAYQMSSARDELARHYHAGAELLLSLIHISCSRLMWAMTAGLSAGQSGDSRGSPDIHAPKCRASTAPATTAKRP